MWSGRGGGVNKGGKVGHFRFNFNEELEFPHNHNYGKFLGNGEMVNPIFDRRPKQMFDSF